jgi:hypothetical protein
MAEHKAPSNKNDNEKIDELAQETPPEQKSAITDGAEPNDEELKDALQSAEVAPGQPKTTEPPTAPKLKHSRKKMILICSAVVVALLTVLFAVPVTRYGLLGVVVKRDVTVSLVDSKTNKPVSEAEVGVAGKTAKTDAQGKASFKAVSVGSKAVIVKKKFYQDLSHKVLVPVTGSGNAYQLSIVATGRQVPIKVINKMSTKPAEGAQISAAGTSSKTDKNGEAVLVLPADKATQEATITLDGYNKAQVTVQVTEQKDDRNTFKLVPSGKAYFLSKRSGKIDVMKSDLDGGNPQTVLAGTGKEEDGGTVLLASRDWKYLALKSRRDGDKAKLYLIDTASNDKLSTIDEGDATFTTVGWYNEYFVYTLNRNNVKQWEPKQSALKGYNVKTGQLSTLDETDATGTNANNYAQEVFGDTYILENLLVYTKFWYGDSVLVSSKHTTINSVQPNGQQKRVAKDLGTISGGIAAKLYKPQELFFQLNDYTTSKTTFYEFEDGQVKDANIKADDFNKFYPTFLVSPSGKSTFWYEPRDGKNTLFVGDSQASNGKEIATLSEFTPYGWYGEDYLLVSKGGSELFIISRNNPSAPPLKITDYHKPQLSFTGYGYGYGGF